MEEFGFLFIFFKELNKYVVEIIPTGSQKTL